MIKILIVAGTRPEVIKMAPVAEALGAEPWAQVRILATGQHREMLDQALNLFGLKPDIDLNVMRPDQTLAQLTARLATDLDECLSEEEPDIVLAEGDTTTVLMTALACYYKKIPFGHVEAGLRSGDNYYPFPEEMNRQLCSRIAALHFAPTQSALDNLLAEGIPERKIFVTGNTVIDALHSVAKKDIPIGVNLDPTKRLILVTAHRRENFGDPMLRIMGAIRELASKRDDIQFLYPVHPNPNVMKMAHSQLGGVGGVALSSPLDYGPFVSAMKSSYLCLTDSGGVQEEAPALGKPVLVLRDQTERPEAVAEGVARLVGPNRDAIISQIEKLLDNKDEYQKMARGVSPYGDGKAAKRITEALYGFFE